MRFNCLWSIPFCSIPQKTRKYPDWFLLWVSDNIWRQHYVDDDILYQNRCILEPYLRKPRVIILLCSLRTLNLRPIRKSAISWDVSNFHCIQSNYPQQSIFLIKGALVDRKYWVDREHNYHNKSTASRAIYARSSVIFPHRMAFIWWGLVQGVKRDKISNKNHPRNHQHTE